jgi:hypothetical protein
MLSKEKIGVYQSKEQQSVVIARRSACPKHPHEPLIALEPQLPFLGHLHVLSHLPYPHRVVEDRAHEQATGVYYHLS